MITRSHLIHEAVKQVPSRFLLVRAVARASRLMHMPGTRMGLTINKVLRQIGTAADQVIDNSGN